MKEWLSVATRRDIVIRGLKVGAIVGTILVAINQGDVILAGQLDAPAAWKISLTYLVPYCVSTYGGVCAIRANDKPKSGT
jgi:Mg/Co/Ni transporter MgtE